MSQVAYVKITVGEEEKLMKYDYNAVADLEDMYDTGLFELLDEKKMGLRTIRALYWAGLKWKEPKMTLAKAGNIVEQLLVEGTDLEDLTQPIFKALQKAKFIKALGVEFDEVPAEGDGGESDPN